MQARVRRLGREVRDGLAHFGDDFPAPSSTAGVYPAIGNIEWTNGFWTGMLWMAYELTGATAFRQAAASQLPSFAWRLEQDIQVDHHDLGFLYMPSAVAAWRITGETAPHRMAELKDTHRRSARRPARLPPGSAPRMLERDMA